MARQRNNIRTYYQACGLALSLFNASAGNTIPISDIRTLTTPLDEMLETLENALVQAETTVGHEDHAPSPSLLLAACIALEDRPGLLNVNLELIRVLERLVRVARYAHTNAGNQTQVQRAHETREALHRARRLYDALRTQWQGRLKKKGGYWRDLDSYIKDVE